MADIITLRDEPHLAAEALLPWYVNGQLDPDEHGQLDAHIAGCAECQAALNFEQSLMREIAALPIDVEHGWSRMQDRLNAERRRPAGGSFGSIAGARRAGPGWFGWAVAAQAALLVAVGGVAMLPRQPTPAHRAAPAYHALSAPAVPRAGNIVVIFRPETPERDLRAALVANNAHLVDGPTASDAYVLSVPMPDRASVLTRLRARADVVLAEPTGPGARQ